MRRVRAHIDIPDVLVAQDQLLEMDLDSFLIPGVIIDNNKDETRVGINEEQTKQTNAGLFISCPSL